MRTFSRLVHTVRPSFDGRYLVDHLACGEYFTAASGDLEDGEWFDRPTCQGLPGTTLRMAITRGQRHNANLRGSKPLNLAHRAVDSCAAMKPLVSCILATRDRPAFLRQALRCYAAQDYPNKELIVVDDGATSAEPLCAGVRDLTYLRLRERTPTGAKLNLGIEASRGSILQKIDDDDFYAPAFLSTAAARLVRARRADAVVTWCCFVVLITGEPVLYFSGHGWMTGGTLCFHRQLWQRHRFRNIYRTSDGWFIRDARPFVARVCDPEQYIVVRHGGNTWRRIEGQPSVEGYFRRRPYHKKVREIVGRRNGPFYEALMARPLKQS